jgi:DNA-binding NtrC family response regulator
MAAARPTSSDDLTRPLAEQVEALERAAIGAALRQTHGNRLAAARLLRMSRAALYDRLSRFPELADGA